jgi:hypothetical protein
MIKKNQFFKVYFYDDRRLFTKENLEHIYQNMNFISIIILEVIEENKSINLKLFEIFILFNKFIVIKYFLI